jgi:ketosteroid isomerase-like protein
MPTCERVEDLIGTVEAGKYVEALERFYADEASTQENLGARTSGLGHLIEKEQLILRAHRSISARTGSRYLVDGDTVVIHWVFDFVHHDGRTFSMDELTHQTWKADRIVEERFYYDPAQRSPVTN